MSTTDWFHDLAEGYSAIGIKCIDESRVVQLPEIMQVPQRHRAHLFGFGVLETAEFVCIGHALMIWVRLGQKFCDASIGNVFCLRYALAQSFQNTFGLAAPGTRELDAHDLRLHQSLR